MMRSPGSGPISRTYGPVGRTGPGLRARRARLTCPNLLLNLLHPPKGHGRPLDIHAFIGRRGRGRTDTPLTRHRLLRPALAATARIWMQPGACRYVRRRSVRPTVAHQMLRSLSGKLARSWHQAAIQSLPCGGGRIPPRTARLDQLDIGRLRLDQDGSLALPLARQRVGPPCVPTLRLGRLGSPARLPTRAPCLARSIPAQEHDDDDDGFRDSWGRIVGDYALAGGSARAPTPRAARPGARV